MVSAEFVNCAGLPPGTLLDVETKNRHYRIECLGGSTIRISGHPEYCPTPVSGILSEDLITRGQHLHFVVDSRRPVTTSRVVKVRVQQPMVSPSIH